MGDDQARQVYQLKDVEELFGQEQALMGVLKSAAKQHNTLRSNAQAASDRGLDLLAQAEQAIAANAEAQKAHAWPRFLEMPNPELCKHNPPNDVVAGLRGLKQQLQALHQDMAGVWPGVFSSLVQAAVEKVEALDAKLAHIEAAPRGDAGLALLPQPMLVRLEVLSGLGSSLDTTASIEAVAAIRAQLRDLSQAQGMPMDPSTAGQVGWAKVQLQTKLVENLKNLIRCIEATEAENAKLSNLAEIRVTADHQAAQIKEPRLRLKMQCESALRGVKQAVGSMDNAHAQESAQFEAKINASKQKLQANVQRQSEIWEQMSQMYEELGALTLERSGEVQFQVEAYDKEHRRREEYRWGKQVAEEHMRMLNSNITNCQHALQCLEAAESFVHEGTDTAGRYQEATAVDLSTQRGTLIQEVERELAVLHSWTTEHRLYVQDQLAFGRAATPASPVRAAGLQISGAPPQPHSAGSAGQQQQQQAHAAAAAAMQAAHHAATFGATAAYASPARK